MTIDNAVTVRQLINVLSTLPPTMQVYIGDTCEGNDSSPLVPDEIAVIWAMDEEMEKEHHLVLCPSFDEQEYYKVDSWDYTIQKALNK